jgi:pimeloyl-ACP methyl ester carboxylesterase
MRRFSLLALAALLSATALAGCSVINDLRGAISPTERTDVPAEAPPAAMPGTERFYAQQLTWAKCSGGLCAQLEVPIDYAEPDGATIELAVLMVPATSGSRLGALVVNPGGPGGSGVDYARAAAFGAVVTAPVHRKYDVVGFDPRGVGRSAPIDCLDGAQLDAFMAQDPTPDTDAERAAAVATAAGFGEACAAKDNPLLLHVSTAEAAKDMDILRSRLGDAKLTYLGKSYGTYLGAVYAGLFPEHVGRLVLDGAIDPTLTSERLNLGQAVGFERATLAWAEACAAEQGCPFPGDATAVMSGLGDLLRELDSKPLTVTGDRSVPAVTEGWASYGVAAAMYDQGMWDQLSQALTQATRGDGSGLMDLADRYADRNPGGTYSTNLMQALWAVNCLDKPEPAGAEERVAQQQRLTAQAPLWGPFMAWGSLVCATWPQPDGTPPPDPAPITAAGSGPIVAIGTTRDPATPYEWAVGLADQLEKGTLITYDGDGHTAYTRSNQCVDDAVDNWFIDGVVPAADLRC